MPIATAMMHIRSCNVLHRALKTTNILVNAIRTGSSSQEPVTEEGSRYDVKLADFGLSKYKMGDSMFTTKASEAQFWRAPEMSEARNYSWPADVFSYGIVCYEILSGKKPFEEKQGPELLKLVRARERPGIPAYCPTTVAELVNGCWATNPAVRPEFAEICTKLEGYTNVNRMRVASLMAGH